MHAPDYEHPWTPMELEGHGDLDELRLGTIAPVNDELPAIGCPMWPGDVGIPSDHLEDWTIIERALRLTTAHSTNDGESRAWWKRPRSNADKVAALTLADIKDDFHHSKAFIGERSGFTFKTGQFGIGYYREAAAHAAASKTTIVLDDLVPHTRSTPSLLSYEADRATPFRRRRARRARHPNGKRKAFPTRASKANMLPPVGQLLVGPSGEVGDRSWKEQGLWAIDCANGNSWQTLETCMVLRSKADILLAQETKIFEDDRLVGASLSARAAGWNPTFTPALRTAASKGSGGGAVLVRKGSGIKGNSIEAIKTQFQHRMCVSWIDAVFKGGVHCISIWLKDSEGMSATNKAILEELAVVIGGLKGPWVVGGDWNLTPDILMASNWPAMVGGRVRATTLATCHSSVYDFFVIDKSIDFAVAGVQRLSDGAMYPHWASRLLLRGDSKRYAVRRLIKAKRIDGVLPCGPGNAPPSYQHIIEANAFGSGQDDTEVTADLEGLTTSWYKLARTEFGDILGDLVPFKAPKFKWTSAAGERTLPWSGASKRSVMWRSLARTAEDVERALATGVHLLRPTQMKVLTQQLAATSKATSRLCNSQRTEIQSTVDRWGESLRTAVTRVAPQWVHSLRAVADVQAKKAECEVQSVRANHWRIKVGAKPSTPGHAAFPTKVAYRWTSGATGWEHSPIGEISDNEKIPILNDSDEADDEDTREGDEQLLLRGPPLDAAVPLADQAALEKEADKWGKLWKVKDNYREPEWPDNVPMLPKLATWAITAAVMSFPIGTGLGADNISPRAVARLSEQALLALATLFLLFEQTGTWTNALNLVLIVLLPKPDGGFRPIGLFPTIIRVWMRARVVAARTWEAANAIPSLYGGKGMGAQRAAWEAAFIAELSALKRIDHLQILLDLVKAFETVPHHLLVKAARENGYPLALLRLSLAAYRLARSIGTDGVFSRILVAVRGITAGSGFATTELRLFMLDTMIELKSRWPVLSTQLYVDDLTISASGVAERLLRLLDRVLQFLVSRLQDDLLMEVSTKKSVVMAGRPALAKRFAQIAKSKVTKAVRQTKLLGTEAVGGRKRSTVVFRKRVKQMTKRVRRFRALRKVGVNTKQMARAAVTPAITYGMDIMGLADGPLLEARRLVVKTAAPPNAGKNVDATLAALDGRNGTLDVAFDAHLLGLRHWAHAHWEHWFDHDTLAAAFQHGASKVAKAVGSTWGMVHGPVTALVASLDRLGWCMPSSGEAIDDLGCSWSFIHDPPAVVLEAGRRSVRRWRHLRILKNVHGAIPERIDAGYLQASGRTFLLDFSDITAALCKQNGPSKLVPFWSPSYRGDMLSALSGGQWTQARRASVPAWKVEDNRCQLCLEAVGTAAHRFMCSATRPATGWPEPPAAASLGRKRIGVHRRQLLDQRGIITLRLPMQEQHEACIKWFLWPDSFPDDVTWYIDGSMLFREVFELRAVGFGIVAHSRTLGLVAYGGGCPPWWCRTAAAAEAWALYMVLALNPDVPTIKTDCLALLNTAQAGLVAAMTASKKLARVWGLIGTVLDGNLSHLADATILVWLPAHLGFNAVSRRVLSNGRLYTTLDWRANRLVDALAKAFANDMAAPKSLMDVVLSARVAQKHSLALLGCVTHRANNHVVAVTRDDGSTTSVTKRDVTEPPTRHLTKDLPKERTPAAPAGEAQGEPLPDCEAVDEVWTSCTQTKRLSAKDRAARSHHKRAKVSEEQCVLTRLADIGAACTARAATLPSATARLQAIAERVKAKAQG